MGTTQQYSSPQQYCQQRYQSSLIEALHTSVQKADGREASKMLLTSTIHPQLPPFEPALRRKDKRVGSVALVTHLQYVAGGLFTKPSLFSSGPTLLIIPCHVMIVVCWRANLVLFFSLGFGTEGYCEQVEVE